MEMTFVDTTKDVFKTKKFEDIEKGEIFVLNDRLYLKVKSDPYDEDCKYNAVLMKTGILQKINEDAECYITTSTLQFEKIC